MKRIPIITKAAVYFAFASSLACAPGNNASDARVDAALNADIGSDTASRDGSTVDASDGAVDEHFDSRGDAPADAFTDVGVDSAPTEPAFDSLAWTVIGTGVSYKDSHNPRGENVFIGY